MESTRLSPHAAELQARAAEVRDDAVLDGEACEGGRDAEPRFVARAQDLHVDAFLMAQGCQELLSVPGVPRTAEVATARMRARGHSKNGARRSGARPERAVDGVTGQRAGRAIAEPRGHALLGEDVIADAGHDPDEM